MNRTLPPGDRGHRSGDSHGSHRSAGALPGAIGLVSGVTHSPERATPPGWNPAARRNWRPYKSAFDRIAALAVLPLRGNNGQAHFLTNGSRKEAAQRMRLPASGFEQLLSTGSARPFQQFEDGRGFAALACVVSCASRRFLLRGGLLSRLGFGGRSVRATCASSGLFRRLRIRCCFRLFCGHVVSLGGDYRDHMNCSGRSEMQVNSVNPAGRWDGDADPQMSPDVSPCQV